MDTVRAQSSELDDASLAVMSGDMSLVSVRINGALERGQDRFGILKGLRHRLRGLLDDLTLAICLSSSRTNEMPLSSEALVTM